MLQVNNKRLKRKEKISTCGSGNNSHTGKKWPYTMPHKEKLSALVVWYKKYIFLTSIPFFCLLAVLAYSLFANRTKAYPWNHFRKRNGVRYITSIHDTEKNRLQSFTVVLYLWMAILIFHYTHVNDLSTRRKYLLILQSQSHKWHDKETARNLPLVDDSKYDLSSTLPIYNIYPNPSNMAYFSYC